MALEADVAERGQRLLAIGENQWYDRKSSRVSAGTVARALTAFANAEGGVLVIGLRDGVEGIDSVSPKRQTAWRAAAVDLVRPAVRYEIREVDCVNDDGEPDRLMVIEIDASSMVHATGQDEVVLRTGGQSRTLTFAERQTLFHQKSPSVFEATSIDAAVDSVDSALLREFAAAAGFPCASAVLTDADVLDVLSARSLLDSDGRLNIAGVLLFARRPEAFLVQAQIRMTKYRGRVRGTGADQQIERDERFEGPLATQIAAASEMVDEVLPRRRALGSAGLFGPTPVVPEAAWREGIVNAAVHRSYADYGDYVRVDVFDDRIEIRNPGQFPGKWSGVDPGELRSYARNPRIARVCSDMSVGQDRGEGVRRMFDVMGKAGLPPPHYEQPVEMTRLTLWSDTADVPAESGLKPLTRRLLGFLRAEGVLSTGDVAALAGVSRPTAATHLRVLREAELVEWVGRSSTDPRAYWRVRGGDWKRLL